MWTSANAVGANDRMSILILFTYFYFPHESYFISIVLLFYVNFMFFHKLLFFPLYFDCMSISYFSTRNLFYFYFISILFLFYFYFFLFNLYFISILFRFYIFSHVVYFISFLFLLYFYYIHFYAFPHLSYFISISYFSHKI